ncbi:MAG: rRNA (guanosine2251-2-O)-methyltransferase [Patescibacteria group bacterium]|nr:rRNA (guanosine2251-2-O)-methyltransferase [Patescibacteria group bacterium]
MSTTKSDIRDIVLIIHNVRSAANVGSMFRTADGAGVREIWLTGYTPCPADPDRKYLTKAEKSFAKTALGAEYFVVWKKEANLGNVITCLRASGYLVVGLEQDDRSVPLGMIRGSRSVALIVGNEVRGLDRRILARCDVIGELPMRGRKNSLNVSVACGIALYVFRGIIK